MRYQKNTFIKCVLLCTALSVTPVQRPVSVYGSTEVSAKQDSSKVCEFSIKTDKIEYKDDSGRVRGIVSFEYPQIKGESSAVKKINKQIRQKSQKFLKSDNAVSIKEGTQDSIKSDRFYDEEEQYYWKTLCSVSYNKNNIVSFSMSEQWYAGGVYNQSDYGLNYNIKTGKELDISDVISGNSETKILKAAKKYCGSDTAAYNIVKKTKKYKFFLTDGLVNICYGSYELGHGTSWDIFSVTGKYK